MFCPKCGKINPDSEAICSGCGAILHEETAVPEKKKKSGWKIAVTLLIVVAVVVAAVILLNGCGAENASMGDNVSF